MTIEKKANSLGGLLVHYKRCNFYFNVTLLGLIQRLERLNCLEHVLKK